MTDSTAKKLATYEDLCALPDDVIGELINGELIVSPRPSPKHAKVSSLVNIELGGPYQKGSGGGPGGWIFLYEPEVQLGQNITVPDIAGWKKERFPVAAPETNYISIAPDWILEVISPSTGRLDRALKMPRYAEHSVPFVWLIDPNQKTLEVYALERDKWTLIGTHSGSDKVRAEPFSEIEISLEDLWWD